MLYLIGLGLNMKGYSREAYHAIKSSKKVYLESYTVELPYTKEELEKHLEIKIEISDREKVENLSLIGEAKKQDIALLVYGNPLMATTHITLIEEAKKQKVEIKVIHSASILDAIGETGLQIYKFGKTTSIPKHEADSFIEVVKDNLKINAHSLILVDIGLELNETLSKLKKALEKYKLKIDKIIICSRLGTDESKVLYDKIENLKDKKMKKPFCIIIPGKLHFVERDVLEHLSLNHL